MLGPVIWLTTESDPERDAVGLTSSMLECDRMQYRYRVEPKPSCVRWVDVRDRAPSRVVRALESFGSPETWVVSRLPLRARLADSNQPKRRSRR